MNRDQQNESITRQTQMRWVMEAREDKRIARHLAAAAAEDRANLRLASELDGVAIRQLVNRAYTWARLVEWTGRTEAELRAALAPPFGRPRQPGDAA